MVLSLVFGIVLTTVSLVRYEHESVPDLAVTGYGFPLVWLSHQTTSIAGPVDVWSIQWLGLISDLLFWWVISIAIIFTWNRYIDRYLQKWLAREEK